MRIFLKRFGLFAVLQFLLLLVVLWSYRRQYPPEQNYLAASKDKQSLIRTQASPRLIFIGGSSMAFGVKSAEIAKACGRLPVNMGLHAALGLKYMLSEAEPWLRANDWVIVAPEYQQFGRLAGTSDFLVNLIEIDPRHARYLSRDQWVSVFEDGAIRRLGKEVRAVLSRPGRFFRKRTISKTRPYYTRAGFNANGDIVAHLNAEPPKIKERQFRLPHDPDSVQETVECLNNFAKAAERRGARVWFSHPPLPRPLFEQNKEAFDELETVLARDVRMPQLDRAEDLVFPFEFFFDTWYHLARPGVERRTQLLSERMAAQYRSIEPNRSASIDRGALLGMAHGGITDFR